MSYLGASSDFDLDDDGILRDSTVQNEGFQLDDDGILRDDFDSYFRSGSHWTDSGFDGDRQSSQSTLRNVISSLDDDALNDDDKSINISDLEASRDDLDFSNSLSFSGYPAVCHSFESPRRLRGEYPSRNESSEIFSEEYYRDLRDLGVLLDGSDYEGESFDLSGLKPSDLRYSTDNITKEKIPEVNGAAVIEESGNGNKTGSQHSPETRSSSTISSRSFPEITPEEAQELYANKTYKYVDKNSAFDFPPNSKEDDDEIFFITSRIPSAKVNQRESLSPSQSNTSTRPPSNASHRSSSRPHTPHSRQPGPGKKSAHKEQGNNDKDVNVENIGTREESPLESPRPLSSRSGNLSSRSNSSKKLPKAISQESFFEKSKGEKMPKRLLPKPSTSAEEEYRMKNKSKSTTNISGTSGPVKPTHMTISEITRITMDEADNPDNEDGQNGESEHVELSTKLKQEFVKRKQATVLVQQLQKDYDSLLSKYALAELTIDQMRLGAKINVYSDSPTPNQLHINTMSSPHSLNTINMGGVGGRAVLTASPAYGSRYVSPSLDTSDALNSSSLASGMISGSRSPAVGERKEAGMGSLTDDGTSNTQSGAEQVKANLLAQTKHLEQRIQSFENLVENRQLTLEDKEKVFDKIKVDHEKLRRQYLQSKEDYNVMRRSGAVGTDTCNFDEDKELEGELFKLGMKFDEVHAEIETHLQEGKEHRQPFQSKRLNDGNISDSSENATAIDHLKQKIHDPRAGNDLIPPRLEPEFEQKLERLHDDYNSLMDRNRRLKQMAKTPERDKEIDNLIKKLKTVCDEAPEIFSLPESMEGRMADIKSKEEQLKHQRQSPAHNSVMNTDDVGKIESSNLNFNRVSPSTSFQSNSSLGNGSRPSPVLNEGDRDGAGPSTRVNRPTRHDHDFHDRKNRKGTNTGSRLSLPDSGISDEEEGASALAKLPGPGKFKQMTKQHGADDVDSGFVGSVVGSESNPHQLLQQENIPQQEVLRLHHPGTNPERPLSRGSVGTVSRSRNSSVGSRRDSVGSSQASAGRRHSNRIGRSSLPSNHDDDSDLSDSSTKPQRGRNKKTQSTSCIETDEADTDVTPRPTHQTKSLTHQSKRQQEQVQHPERESLVQSRQSLQSILSGERTPVTSQLSLSSGERTPVSTQPIQSMSAVRQSLDNIATQILPQPFSPHRVKRSPEQRYPESMESPQTNHAVRSRRDIARGFRNLTTLGPPSDPTDSDVTRASSTRSGRLQALQDQVNRLRETILHQNGIPPPPAPVPNPHQEPEYYDPFDDPYGFMRMPRRRANSFSGRGGREFDDLYLSLNSHRHDDIPLGYAAADAYADVVPAGGVPPLTSSPVHARSQQKRVQRRKKRSEERARVHMRSGYGSDPMLHISSPAPVHPEQARLQQGVPSPSKYSTAGMRQQSASQGYFITPSGAKIYTSKKGGKIKGHTGNREFPPPGPQAEMAYRPPVHSPPHQPPAQWRQDQQYYTNPGVSRPPPCPTHTDTCVLCGGTGVHVHDDKHRYTTRVKRRNMSRSRSRSVPRQRATLNERVYVDYTDTSDSDEDYFVRQRSQSLSSTRPARRHVPLNDNTDYTESESDFTDVPSSLDDSLRLSDHLKKLTRKLKHQVGGELRRITRQREFGSSDF